MYVEVDQSGKIEVTNRDTILAFSNDEQSIILIPSRVKREILGEIRDRRTRQRPYFILFAMALYELLKDHLGRLRFIVIDVEYTGRDQYIKSELLKLIRTHDPDYPEQRIIFAHIGKKSEAHRKALGAYRGEIEVDRIITTKSLKRLLE
jgi:hypothetical protein